MQTTAEFASNSSPTWSACGMSTLGDLLRDPMTVAVMKADRVDAGALEKMLKTQARRLRRDRALGAARQDELTEHELARPRLAAPSMHDVIAARVSHGPFGWLGTW